MRATFKDGLISDFFFILKKSQKISILSISPSTENAKNSELAYFRSKNEQLFEIKPPLIIYVFTFFDTKKGNSSTKEKKPQFPED